MRICLITPYYIPIKGGISSYVFNLYTNLNGKNHKSFVITNLGIKDSQNVYVANTNKIFFIYKAFLQIRKIKPDVLHSHAHWYVLVPCVFYKLTNPKTAVLHTFHTDPMDDTKGIKRIVMKLILSRCDVLTFVSIYLRDKIMRNFELNIETKVIYGGVSQAIVDEKEICQFKKKFNLENHFPVISFVGVMSWKMKAEGVNILIRAFKQVSEKFPKSLLLIVGDGTYRKEIENLVEELGIKSQVVFTGFVDNTLIPLSTSDIYTHISLQEGGVSLAVLEAMSLGKPVIASRTGGIPEAINNEYNGLIVETNPECVAESITRLILSQENRYLLGSNARKTIEDRFMWSKIAEDLLFVYFSSLEKKSIYLA